MSEPPRKTLPTSQRNYGRHYATNYTFLAVIGTYHMPQECALYDSVFCCSHHACEASVCIDVVVVGFAIVVPLLAVAVAV